MPIPPVLRNSPGFALPDVQIIFPISQRLALLGEYEGRSGEIEADRRLVAWINTHLLLVKAPRIYAPKLKFPILDKAMNIRDGSYYFQQLTEG